MSAIHDGSVVNTSLGVSRINESVLKSLVPRLSLGLGKSRCFARHAHDFLTCSRSDRAGGASDIDDDVSGDSLS
jgi:hypothetical protein